MATDTEPSQYRALQSLTNGALQLALSTIAKKVCGFECSIKSVSKVLGQMWALLALGWVSQDF